MVSGGRSFGIQALPSLYLASGIPRQVPQTPWINSWKPRVRFSREKPNLLWKSLLTWKKSQCKLHPGPLKRNLQDASGWSQVEREQGTQTPQWFQKKTRLIKMCAYVDMWPCPLWVVLNFWPTECLHYGNVTRKSFLKCKEGHGKNYRCMGTCVHLRWHQMLWPSEFCRWLRSSKFISRSVVPDCHWTKKGGRGLQKNLKRTLLQKFFFNGTCLLVGV